MGDEEGNLLWLDTRRDEAGEILLSPPQWRDGGPIRSAVCGFDFTGDGRDDMVVLTRSGRVLLCDGEGEVEGFWNGAVDDSGAVGGSTSPVLADLTNDRRPEIIVAHHDGNLYAFQAPRAVPGPLSILWKASPEDTVDEELALADLTGDEVSEVVLVTRNGTLAMLDGRDGHTLRSWSVGALGSPLIEDINGDGLLELIAPADTCWAIIETGAKAFPGNTWPTWRGDSGRRGLHLPPAGRSPVPLLALSGLLLVASVWLWAKS
jgi:hypothetical protein